MVRFSLLELPVPLRRQLLICTLRTQVGGYKVNIRVRGNSTDLRDKGGLHHFFCPLITKEMYEFSDAIVCTKDFISVSEVGWLPLLWL